MELRKKVAVALGLVAAAAVIFCICVQAGTDKEVPKITFGEELTLVTGDTSEEMLLADVKAEDNHDGDISARVIVGEQIVKEDMVEIVYIVVDDAGNVASKTRVIPYGQSADVRESEDWTEDDDSAEEGSVENNSVENNSEEETAEGTEEIAEESMETSEEETAVPETPVITLNQSSVTLPVGSRFEYSTYIASVSDDVDTKVELFRNLVITGYYDVNTPGTYPLEFWLVDKDGNQSERQSFTLIIE